MFPFEIGMQDWNYVHTNDFEITLELGCHKYPPHGQLAPYWSDNRDALVAFIERVHTGIKGFVTDKTTGKPIASTGQPYNGTINIDEIRHSIKVAPGGDYFRLLTPGTYTVSARVAGYEQSTQKVYVPNAFIDPATQMLSAKTVNFSLEVDHSR